MVIIYRIYVKAHHSGYHMWAAWQEVHTYPEHLIALSVFVKVDVVVFVFFFINFWGFSSWFPRFCWLLFVCVDAMDFISDFTWPILPYLTLTLLPLYPDPHPYPDRLTLAPFHMLCTVNTDDMLYPCTPMCPDFLLFLTLPLPAPFVDWPSVCKSL